MTDPTQAAYDALSRAHDTDNPKEAAAHRREADTFARLAIADAIQALAPNPIEAKDRTYFAPGVTSALHSAVMASRGNHPQDATGSPQSDEQPEPEQQDGGEATEVREFSDCPRCDHHLRAVQHFKSRAEKAEAELESSRRGGVVLSATDYTTLVDRAGKAEAALEAARSTADHFAAERDKCHNDLVDIASRLRRARAYGVPIMWTGAMRKLIDRYAPEG